MNKLPKLSEEIKKNLSRPITIKRDWIINKNFPNKESPELDGFISKIYQNIYTNSP